MNIVFPFVGDSVGGSHRSIIELHKELIKFNITSSIVVHKKGPLTSMLDDVNIMYIYLPIDRFAGESPSVFNVVYSILINFIRISRFIKNNKIAIVHGNDLRINLTWSLPTKLSGAFYLWHQRSLMSSSILWKIFVVLADHFVTISKYVHQSLPGNIPESKKTLVLNPFDTRKHYGRDMSRKWINKFYNIPSNSILIGYIGRLVDWKNVDFLIKGFSKYVSKSNTSLHLLIVGTGEVEYVNTLKKITDKLGVKKMITFTGFNSEPDRVIAAFDLMIAPSSTEPFGRTLVEAMIQNTPVLASRGGAHSEIIDNGVTGRMYDHNNINDFIDQFDLYINDRAKCKIVKTAHNVATLRYSSCQHARHIVDIYQQLITV
jgi:glycosyltransferase involved in cell wall biosynthesis